MARRSAEEGREQPLMTDWGLWIADCEMVNSAPAFVCVYWRLQASYPCPSLIWNKGWDYARIRWAESFCMG